MRTFTSVDFLTSLGPFKLSPSLDQFKAEYW